MTPGELVDATDPDVKLPVVISEPRPRYPSLAREHMLEGTVELRAQVDDAGAVVAAEVTRAAPSGVGFEEAALDYVRARRYRPATKDGVPVQVWIRIIVKFRMPRG